MAIDSAPLNRGRIFVLSLLALFTAGAAVSLRAATAVHMRADYLDAIDPAHAGEMIGGVLGAAFAGFAVTLLLVSAVLAKIGFGRALAAAAALLIVGFILVGFAGSLGVSPYTGLLIGMVVQGFGWGLVETVINPLTSALYPHDRVSRLSILHAWYPGENGGQALAEILFGDVNPSGKLPITMEKRAQDNPAYATFPNPVNQHPDSLNYSEGVFIGYRGYDHSGIQPLFPFGFGLSYTTFSFSNLSISPASYDGTQPVTVTFTVTNTGNVAGAEVAQLYVGEKKPPLPRPVRELKGFQKVLLQPGQSQQVTLQLDQRSFAYWNINKEKWDAPKDTYNVWVGSSSQLSDLTLQGQVSLVKDITSNP